jgi:hypothetical protein
MPFPIILAIDPSVNNLGWACHNLNLGKNRYDIHSDAWRFGVIHPTMERTEIQYRWRNAFAKLKKRLGDWRPTHFASEYPTFFGSASGKIAAMQGYTLDLAGMVGYIAGRFGMPPDFITLWKPEQWKGSVPKHITAAKFVRLFGPKAERIVESCSDDVIDAIMIAEKWLTLYHREKFSWIQRTKAKANL